MNNNFNQIQKPTGFGFIKQPPTGSMFNNNYDPYCGNNIIDYNMPQYNSNINNSNSLVNLLLNNIDILDELENNISIEDLWVDLLYASIDKNLLNKLPKKFETEDFYIKLINKMLEETRNNILQNNINSFKSIVVKRKETDEKEQYKNNKECGYNNKDTVLLKFDEINNEKFKKYRNISSNTIINTILDACVKKLNIISNLGGLRNYKLSLFVNIFHSKKSMGENVLSIKGQKNINLSTIPSTSINNILNQTAKYIRDEIIKYIYKDKEFNIDLILQLDYLNK